MIPATVTGTAPVMVRTEGSTTSAPATVATHVGALALNDEVVVIPYRSGLLVLCRVPVA